MEHEITAPGWSRGGQEGEYLMVQSREVPELPETESVADLAKQIRS